MPIAAETTTASDRQTRSPAWRNQLSNGTCLVAFDGPRGEGKRDRRERKADARTELARHHDHDVCARNTGSPARRDSPLLGWPAELGRPEEYPEPESVNVDAALALSMAPTLFCRWRRPQPRQTSAASPRLSVAGATRTGQGCASGLHETSLLLRALGRRRACRL